MFTIKDFSSIAFYVYRDMPSIIKNMPNIIYQRRQYYPEDFLKISKSQDGIFEIIIDDAIQNVRNINNDFYGSIFIKVKGHKATGMTIGIRGTVASILGNDWADIHSWWKSVFNTNAKVFLPTYFVSMAMHLCDKALHFAKNELKLLSSNVFVTGHSLGGAVAGLIPTKVHLPICAVTFNAPGIKNISGVIDNWSRVINIRSQYDFISAIGEAIGPVWNVFVPNKAEEAKTAFKISEEKKQHPIEFALKDSLHIENLLEDNDFLNSVLAQHKMINLWRALTHNVADEQTYAAFEGFLQFLTNS